MIGDLRRCPGRIRTLTGGTRIRSATITPLDNYSCFTSAKLIIFFDFCIKAAIKNNMFNIILHYRFFSGKAETMAL